MSATPVPIELVEYTVQLCEDLDTRTLRSCSVVHSALTALCQKRLFKSVRVSGARWDRLLALLAASAHIGPYIRHLTLWDFDDRNALPLDTVRLTARMLPRVVSVLCTFNVRLKSGFFVKLPTLDTLVIGKDCAGPLRPNHASTGPERIHLQRLHVTRPFPDQDQLLRWTQGTASPGTLRSVRLFFAPEDGPATVQRAVRALGQMRALEHLLLDVSELVRALGETSSVRLSGCTLMRIRSPGRDRMRAPDAAALHQGQSERAHRAARAGAAACGRLRAALPRGVARLAKRARAARAAGRAARHLRRVGGLARVRHAAAPREDCA
jgi:hypothetical protein